MLSSSQKKAKDDECFNWLILQNQIVFLYMLIFTFYECLFSTYQVVNHLNKQANYL